MHHYPGQLFLLSGPSAVGKTTIESRLRQHMAHLVKIVTYTTREPRPHEQNGIHYHFVTKRHFQDMIEDHAFLEWAVVHTQLYGTPKQTIIDALKAGKHIALIVDVQGAMRIKEQLPHDCHLIFIAPDSLENLRKRLGHRQGGTDAEIQVRLDDAQKEMAFRDQYDYVVVNKEGHIAQTVAEIARIIQNVAKAKRHA